MGLSMGDKGKGGEVRLDQRKNPKLWVSSSFTVAFSYF